MSDTPKAELLRSLGKVVRGLSALFWGLPLALVAYVQSARTDWLEFFGPFSIVPAMVLTGLIWYALSLCRDFQKQETIWQRALDRASIFAVLNLGLVPFLFWWHRLPFVPLYRYCIALLVFSSLFLLIQLNNVLRRLTAMLPDETLRTETITFTQLNTMALSILVVALSAYFVMLRMDFLPNGVQRWLALLNADGLWLTVFLTLMPMAITMALIWKIKEIIFSSVFNAAGSL